jgi:hypothetical protein
MAAKLKVIVKIQAAIKAARQMKKFIRTKAAIRWLQCLLKGVSSFSRYERRAKAAATIQKWFIRQRN